MHAFPELLYTNSVPHAQQGASVWPPAFLASMNNGTNGSTAVASNAKTESMHGTSPSAGNFFTVTGGGNTRDSGNGGGGGGGGGGGSGEFTVQGAAAPDPVHSVAAAAVQHQQHQQQYYKVQTQRSNSSNKGGDPLRVNGHRSASSTTTDDESSAPSSWNVSESTAPSLVTKGRAANGGVHQPGLNPAAAPFQIPSVASKATEGTGNRSAGAEAGAVPFPASYLSDVNTAATMEGMVAHLQQMGYLTSHANGGSPTNHASSAAGANPLAAELAMLSATNPSVVYAAAAAAAAASMPDILAGSAVRFMPGGAYALGQSPSQHGFPACVGAGCAPHGFLDGNGGPNPAYGFSHAAAMANGYGYGFPSRGGMAGGASAIGMKGGYGFPADPRAVTATDLEDLQRVQMIRYRAKMLPRPLSLETHKDIWGLNANYGERKAKQQQHSKSRKAASKTASNTATKKSNLSVVADMSLNAHPGSQRDTVITNTIAGTTDDDGGDTPVTNKFHVHTTTNNTTIAAATEANEHPAYQAGKLALGDPRENTSNHKDTDEGEEAADGDDDAGVETPAEKLQRLSAYRLLLERWTQHMHVLENKADVRAKVLLPSRPCPTLAEVTAAALAAAEDESDGESDPDCGNSASGVSKGTESSHQPKDAAQAGDKAQPTEETLLMKWSDACNAWWEETNTLQQEQLVQRRSVSTNGSGVVLAGNPKAPAPAAVAAHDPFVVTASGEFSGLAGVHIPPQHGMRASPSYTLSDENCGAVGSVGAAIPVFAAGAAGIPAGNVFGTAPASYYATIAAANNATHLYPAAAQLRPGFIPTTAAGGAGPASSLKHNANNTLYQSTASASMGLATDDDDLLVDDDVLAEAYQRQLLKVIEEEEE